MHEAMLYDSLDDKKVRCNACKHECIIPLGKTGICRVRKNQEGRLYLTVYGKAEGIGFDPIEKKPLFHFLPGTNILSFGTIGCNFKCKFCQNWGMSDSTTPTNITLSPKEIVEECKARNSPSIAYTYTEPTIFLEYVYDTAKLATEMGIKNVLVTNGYETDKTLELLKPYIQAMNIDLKSFNEDFYKNICGAELNKVLETIKKAYEINYWIEITTLIIPGKNNSKEELESIANFIAELDTNIPWHVTAFKPYHNMMDVPATTHKDLINAYDIGKNAGLKYVYVGNVVDEERSATICPKCKEKLIERKGFIDKMNVGKDSKCKFCGEEIKGVWQ